MTLEKAIGKTKRLRPRKKQFLRLPNFLLPLRFSFGHKKVLRRKRRATHCSEHSGRVHSRSGGFLSAERTWKSRFTETASQPRMAIQCVGSVDPSQLHPWLVPHSVQTPQAPARITLSLPHTEHVISIKMLPSATMTRSA